MHRTGRTGRAGKSGRNIVMFQLENEKMSLDFFKNIEDSLKCNFKYTNMILNKTDTTNEEDLAKEERRVKKIATQMAYFADKEPR